MAYNVDFGGVVMSFGKVKIEGEKMGHIMSLYPWINFEVSADFLVFAPKPGDELVGTVNKVMCAPLQFFRYSILFYAPIPLPPFLLSFLPWSRYLHPEKFLLYPFSPM